MIRKTFRQRSRKRILIIGAVTTGALLLIGGGAYAALGGAVRTASSSDIDLQKGLVGWWKFDGNTNDSSSNHIASTNNGATLTTDRKGKANSAYSFNGLGNYIDIHSNNLPQNAKPYTLAAWIKPNGSGNFGIIGWGTWGSSASNNGFRTDTNTGNPQLVNYWWSRDIAVQIPTLFDGNWHHVIATYDGTTRSLYFDGNVVGSDTPIAPNIGSGGNARIGSTNNAEWFNGSIDDVRVYKRSISANEAKALASSYDSSVQAASGEKGLVGWWKMDGNAKDSSPNRNNGTVSGATLTTDRKGAANSAFSFNGTSNLINLPTSAALNLNTYTFAAWIYLPSTAGNFAIFGSSNPGGPYWRVANGGLQAQGCANGSVGAGAWHHLVYAVNNSTGASKIYVDGGLNASCNGSVQSYTYSNLQLGVRQNSIDYFNGFIDDVRIYNRVLSATEIAAQYNSYNSQINLRSSPGNSTAAGNINQGLVGYWNFNGNAHDSTPYRGNGTLINTPTLTTDRKGRSNAAYSFTYGSLQEISVPDSVPLSPTTAMSVSLWFKGSVQNTSYDTSGSTAGLIAKDIGGSVAQNPIYEFKISNGILCFGTTDNTNVNQTITYSGLLDTNWYQAVGTFDGYTMKLYVNGAYVNSKTQVTLDDSTGALRIGRQKSGFDRYFNGTIDEVRVYNRALSAAEVQTLYGSNE